MSALTLNKYQIMPYLLASAWQGSSQMGPAVGLPRAAPERVLPLPPACSFLVEHYFDYRSHQTDPWALNDSLNQNHSISYVPLIC